MKKKNEYEKKWNLQTDWELNPSHSHSSSALSLSINKELLLHQQKMKICFLAFYWSAQVFVYFLSRLSRGYKMLTLLIGQVMIFITNLFQSEKH